MKCVAQKRLCFKAPIPVSRQFSSGLLGKLRLQEGSDADTASSSGARFSHTGESEGLVMKHRGPWERLGADTNRVGEGEIRAPLALLGAQIPPSPFSACHEGKGAEGYDKISLY